MNTHVNPPTHDGAGIVKAENMAKLVTDQVASHLNQQALAATAGGRKAEVRKRIVDARLRGVPDALLASLPDTDDEKALGEAADALRKTIESIPGVKLLDTPGVSAGQFAESQAKGGGLKMAGGSPVMFGKT